MTGGRLAHLNPDSVPGAIASAQPLFFSPGAPSAAASQIDSAMTSSECRTPDGPLKLTVHVRSATAPERITFAFVSPADVSSLTSRDRHPAGL